MKRKMLFLCAISIATVTTIANASTTVNQQAASGNILTSIISASVKQNDTNTWLSRTSVNVGFQKNWKPLYSVEMIHPLTEYTNHKNNLLFLQTRISNTADIGTTSNIGVGYRHLTNNGRTMYGVNTFYDYGFKEHHKRISLGVEALHGQSELRANLYKGLSGEKEVDATAHLFEKVVNGYDVEYATTFKNAAYARVYANVYNWDYKHDADKRGVKLGAEVQLTPRVAVDIGYNKTEHSSGEPYGQIMYRLDNNKVALWGGNHSRENKITVRNKMLEKVRRNNNIVVERYSKNEKNEKEVKSKTINYSIRIN